MVLFDENVKKVRVFLKKIILESTDFVGYKSEREQVFNLLKRTVETGESNSAVLIGPRNAGKTTLINSVLDELQQNKTFNSKALLVQLNGFIHVDDRLALKGITSQLNLDNAVDGKVFGSFAENLSFLLACLKTGERKMTKSILVIIDEFDLFCSHHNQTLLYNLFDISQSAQTPLCVIGITCRLDIIELFEKRVKSRFSHRQFFLFPEIANLDNRLKRIEDFLLLPEHVDVSITYRKSWNSSITNLIGDKKFRKLMQRLLDMDTSERTLKNILFLIVSALNDKKSLVTVEDFQERIRLLERDELAEALQDLDVLELCVMIAMKHHVEIYDNNAMNFEMILTRYTKFANANSNMQIVQRAVVMKAFEHLENLELISPVHSYGDKLQKEYQLFKLLVTPLQIQESINRSTGLPTEVVQWANSSLF